MVIMDLSLALQWPLMLVGGVFTLSLILRIPGSYDHHNTYMATMMSNDIIENYPELQWVLVDKAILLSEFIVYDMRCLSPWPKSFRAAVEVNLKRRIAMIDIAPSIRHLATYPFPVHDTYRDNHFLRVGIVHNRNMRGAFSLYVV